jgi:hypothetical protein
LMDNCLHRYRGRSATSSATAIAIGAGRDIAEDFLWLRRIKTIGFPDNCPYEMVRRERI